jgi:capsid protein
MKQDYSGSDRHRRISITAHSMLHLQKVVEDLRERGVTVLPPQSVIQAKKHKKFPSKSLGV